MGGRLRIGPTATWGPTYVVFLPVVEVAMPTASAYGPVLVVEDHALFAEPGHHPSA